MRLSRLLDSPKNSQSAAGIGSAHPDTMARMLEYALRVVLGIMEQRRDRARRRQSNGNKLRLEIKSMSNLRTFGRDKTHWEIFSGMVLCTSRLSGGRN